MFRNRIPEKGEVVRGGLSREEQEVLLWIARQTVEQYVQERTMPEMEVDSPALNQTGASFVTLKKDGQLRGCIGHIIARIPLYQCVQEMAVAACSQDRRFPPVMPEELSHLEYEVSVLTPLEEVKDISEIEVGRDGLYIRKGMRSGLLLPQVATEQGWNRNGFLIHTCLKAGLPPDAWKRGAELYRFQAQVFSD
ncbi:MAG: AmmeMemoRadiSam system protein A [Deltaproteobacteria bacterium]|nr:MAG: AmmeMemoRadiSam system protein A [Deltaproteobacteria bacterium]